MRLRLKLLNSTLAAALLSAPTLAPAGPLDDAFSKLNGSMAYQSGGSFSTASRKGYALPGMSMRFPTNTYSLVQVEPPKIEIGCNGIDMHLGSLSFINGRELEKMLNEVANSTAMLFLLALKTMCGPCSTALEWAQGIAQLANNRTLDSCEMAENVVAATTEVGKDLACSSISTMTTNDDDSWLASKQKTCATRKSAAEKTRQGLDEHGTDGDRMANVHIDGNVTWKVLQGKGFAPKNKNDMRSAAIAELFMSWFGTKINDEFPSVQPPRFTDATQFLNVFMCGGEETELEGRDKLNEAIGAVCNSFWSSKDEVKFYKCIDVLGNDPYEECRAMSTQTLKEAKIGEGFLGKVVKLLDGAVSRAASNNPLTQEQMDLIASAPFPLYQGINLATTHPDIGQNLVMSYSLILANQIGIEYIKHVIREAGMNSAGSHIPGEFARAHAEQQTKLVTAVEKVVDNINVHSAMHDTFSHIIQRIQQDMVKSARHSGLVGADFARDLAAAEAK